MTDSTTHPGTRRAGFVALVCAGLFLVLGLTHIGTRGITADAFGTVEGEARDASTRVLALVRLLASIKLDIVQVQQYLQDVSATRGLDGLDDGPEKARFFAEKFDADVRAARQLATEMNLPNVTRMLDAADVAFKPYYEAGKAMADAYVKEGPAAGNKMMSGFDGAADALQGHVDELDHAVNEVVEARLGRMGTGLQTIADTSRIEDWAVLGLAGLGLVISGGAAATILRPGARRRQMIAAAPKTGLRVGGIAFRLSALIGLLCVPIGYLVFEVERSKSAGIDVATAELDGSAYIARLRVAATAVAAAAESGAKPDLAGAIAGIEAVRKEYDETFAVTKTSGDLVADLQAASSERSAAAALMGKIASLTSHVADQSGLTLDPDLDSFYVMDAVTVRIPSAMTQLVALVAQTEAIAARKDVTVEDRIEIAKAKAVLASSASAIASDFQTAFAGNEDGGLAKALSEKVTASAETISAFDAAIDRAMEDGAIEPEDQAAIARAYAAANAALAPLWSGANGELDRLLAERIGGFREEIALAMGISFVLVALSVLALIMISRTITGPIARLTGALGRIASGDLGLEIPGTERTDEVGDIAKAVVEVRDNAAARGRAEAEAAAREREERDREAAEAAEREAATRAEEEARRKDEAEAARVNALRQMAEAVENFTTKAVGHVAESTGGMNGSAKEMSKTALEVSRNAQSVSAATEQVLANIQTVASATEELNASIQEVARQVRVSEGLTGKAAEIGTLSAARIANLTGAVARIGDVVRIISEIAGQTNLLALNATIEAARAGDAGKGFAVVASEVKNLANQTARSADDIVRMVSEINSATEEAAVSVNEIVAHISEVRDAAVMIASAVEQQTGATSEITRNVSETVGATHEVARAIARVSEQADLTGDLASSVVDLAANVDGSVEGLKRSIVEAVRSVDPDVDRRRHARHQVDFETTVAAGGRRVAAHCIDVSRGGAQFTLPEGEPGFVGGQSVEVIGANVGRLLTAEVVDSRRGILRLRWREVLDEATFERLLGGQVEIKKAS
jgi:methyl-accepting chemotaxis protein